MLLRLDELLDELKRLEEESGFTPPYSPTLRVGSEVVSFQPHTHIRRLYSLDKVRTEEALGDWVNKVIAASEDSKPVFALEYKFDGLTVCLTYDNGLFVLGATRGNGVAGADH